MGVMTALAKNSIELPLTSGMNTSVSAEFQDISTLRSASNLRAGDDGEWEKRQTSDLALTLASTGGVYGVPRARAVIESQDAAYVITDDYGAINSSGTYVSSGGNLFGGTGATYAKSGAPVMSLVSRRDLAALSGGGSRQGYHSVASALCSSGMVRVVASIVYENDAGEANLYISAYNETTGALLLGDHSPGLTGGRTAWAVDCCEYADAGGSLGVVITYATGAAAPFSLYKFRYIAASNTIVSDGSLVADLATVRHRVKRSPTDGQVVLAYQKNGTAVLHARDLNAVSGTASATHVGTHSAASGVDIVVHGSAICLVSANAAAGPSVYAERFGTPGTAVVLWSEPATTTIQAITAARQSVLTDEYVATVIIDAALAPAAPVPASRALRLSTVSFAATTCVAFGSASAYVHNVMLRGHAVTADNRAYVLTAPSADFLLSPTAVIWARHDQPLYNVLGTLRPVARACHDTHWLLHSSLAHNLLSTSAIGTTLSSVVPTVASPDKQPATSTILPLALSVSRADLAAQPHAYVARDAGVSLVANGCPFEIDALNAAPPHAHAAPVCTADSSVAGGVTVATGLTLRALYRWVDSAGRLHRSAPGPAHSVAPFVTQQLDVYVTLPPYPPTDSVYDYDVELYVSTDGGSTLYLANDAAGDALHWSALTDCHAVFADVQLGVSSNAAIYSTGAGGDELTAEPVPPLLSVATVGDRVFGIDAEDRSRVWYTKPIVAGFAPEWNSNNTLRVGDIAVGIASAAGVPTVFCERGIWQIYGEGPNALGSGTFAQARRLPHGVECTGAVCETSAGVAFRTRRGVLLLDSQLSIQDIGHPIAQDIARASVVGLTCALVFDRATDELRLLDYDGAHYVFDMDSQRWSKWTEQWAACAYAGGRMWYAISGATDDLKRLSSDDSATRNSSVDAWSLQTPWIAFDQLTGNCRIWELVIQLRTASGASGSTLGGAITVTYETREGQTQSFTWSAAELYVEASSTPGNVVNLRCPITAQRTKRFRVTVAESAPAYASTGHVPLVMRVHYGITPGGDRKRTPGQLKGA